VETGRPSVAALVNMIVMQLELAGVNLAGSNVAGSSAADAHLANSAQRPRPL
jgi:hypothetical protein